MTDKFEKDWISGEEVPVTELDYVARAIAILAVVGVFAYYMWFR